VGGKYRDAFETGVASILAALNHKVSHLGPKIIQLAETLGSKLAKYAKYVPYVGIVGSIYATLKYLCSGFAADTIT
jgi:hypothetical protein